MSKWEPKLRFICRSISSTGERCEKNYRYHGDGIHKCGSTIWPMTINEMEIHRVKAEQRKVKQLLAKKLRRARKKAL